MADLTINSIVLPSGTATYLESGSAHARTVFLLHGGGLDCAHLSWKLLLPELSDKYRVIAPNWPGYGGTDAFGRPYTIGDLGQWLMSLMDELEIEQSTMIGVSMGGGAALWSVVNRPERVNAIVPVGTFGITDKASYHLLTFLLTKLPLNAMSYSLLRRYPSLLRRSVEALFADPKRLTPDLVEEVSVVLKAAGNGAAFTHFQRGETGATKLRSVFAADLPPVSQPTLFIHGERDALVPVDAAKRVANSMKTARIEIMDAGHWPMREQPDKFNELIATFLSEVAITS